MEMTGEETGGITGGEMTGEEGTGTEIGEGEEVIGEIGTGREVGQEVVVGGDEALPTGACPGAKTGQSPDPDPSRGCLCNTGIIMKMLMRATL